MNFWSLPCWHNLEIPWILNFWGNSQCCPIKSYSPPFRKCHCSCPAHTKETDTVPLGNNRADKATTYSAQNGHPYPFSTQFLNLLLYLTDIINYQTNAPLSEKGKWIQKGAKQLSDGLYMYILVNGLPVTSFLLIFWLALTSHQMGHMCRWGSVKEWKDKLVLYWHPQSFWPSYFPVYHLQIPSNIWRKSIYLRKPSTLPFVALQMNFVALPLALGCSHCLVIACIFTGGQNTIQLAELMPQQW